MGCRLRSPVWIRPWTPLIALKNVLTWARSRSHRGLSTTRKFLVIRKLAAPLEYATAQTRPLQSLARCRRPFTFSRLSPQYTTRKNNQPSAATLPQMRWLRSVGHHNGVNRTWTPSGLVFSIFTDIAIFHGH